MKSQDILLLLKLVAIERATTSWGGVRDPTYEYAALPGAVGWIDAKLEFPSSHVEQLLDQALSTRGLAESTGISKSEVSNAVSRCIRSGLAKHSKKTGKLTANSRALFGLICHGAKYFFPASIGPSARGIPTGSSAPIIKDKLKSADGGTSFVWEDSLGKEVGVSVSPIYKSVPYAVRRDRDLYAMLALVDCIRLGREREVAVAQEVLKKYLLVGGE